MNAFIFSQFGYCPLVWMFQSRTLNNRINKIHERSLRIVFKDYESTFQQLLKQNKSVSIHQRNLKILANEIFKIKNCLNPLIMEDVFKFKNLIYNFRNVENLNRSNVNFVKYGTEKITSLSAKIWKILPNNYKELTSLSLFPKLKIGKQMNALADYAKHISSELVLFGWALLRRCCLLKIIVCKYFLVVVVAVVFCLFVVAVVVCFLFFLIGVN